MRKIVMAAGVGLIVGLGVGYFVGRALLERAWAQPIVTLTSADEQRAADGADPTPKAGTKILRAMPIQRARQAMKAFTANDPVVAQLAAAGSGEKGTELHVVVENRSGCAVTEMSGVAYGFDAYGHPATINKSEVYVAFSSDAGVEPGKTATIRQPLHYAKLATNAIAQVDHATCSNGTTWRRP